MPNWRTYESSVRLLSAILAAHPTLKLNYDAMSAAFGGDCTKSALENRFRRIKSDAKLINDAIAKGVDPITLPIGDTDGEVAVRGKNGHGLAEFSFSQHNTLPVFLSSFSRSRPSSQFGDYAKDPTEIAKYYGCGANKKSMENLYYRRVKPEVDLIKDAVANGQDPPELGQGHSKGSKTTSQSFGEDVTENGAPGGSAPKSTPGKRAKSTPKKAKAEIGFGGSGGSDDEKDTFTPSKKTKPAMNKVMSGRVSKPRAKNGVVSYAEDDDEENYEVKGEDYNMEFNNGSSNGYELQGNGNNGHYDNYGQDEMGYGMQEGREEDYDVNEDEDVAEA